MNWKSAEEKKKMNKISMHAGEDLKTDEEGMHKKSKFVRVVYECAKDRDEDIRTCIWCKYKNIKIEKGDDCMCKYCDKLMYIY